MSSPAPTSAYNKLPEEVWPLIRRRWEEGEGFASLARAFRVGDSTVRNRKLREGWTLSQTRRTPEAREALRIAETALARSIESLTAGRAQEAVALIKAGDAVGAFADFVARLRADGDARRTPDDASAAGDAAG